MLQHLHIRNLAIVDSVEIDLATGLTVLTGETGAGKSIVVDALQLATGGRGGAEFVRHGSDRAEVVATFELAAAPAELRALLDEQAVDAGDELVLRRVVTADGKSRGYLNGQQVPLTVLRAAGEHLVDIHGQHEFQSLTRPAAQRQQLDGFGSLQPLAAEVETAHRAAQRAREQRDALLAQAADRDAKLELLRYQVGELDALQLAPGEVPELIAEQSRLSNHGRLLQATRAALELAYDAEGDSAYAIASRALAQLRTAAGLDARLAEILPLLDDATIRLAEAGRELTRYLDGLDLDPARQEFVEQRLATVEQLARKHRVAPDALAVRAIELAAELAQLEQFATSVDALDAAHRAAVERWRGLAQRLSAARATAAERLAEAISTRMQTLGMSGGRFSIAIARAELAADGTAAGGLDQVEYLVSANPGQPLRPLAKVASGGELSRLSLAVQVAASAGARRCMVFDEVDSGVGGAVAEIVGRELAALGERAQVMCVTHLPQVAAQGSQHLRVAKLTDGRSTRTAVTRLGDDERVEEIARMLGGVDVTQKAREHASEMLQARVGNPAPRERAPGNRASAGRGGSGGRSRR
jgi:DNA repair protein RecN (Recombination protein N)